MKTKSKQKITGSPRARKNSVRPIIFSVASALSLMSAQADAAFAPTPIHLQNENKSSGKLAVKHNVLFFIDDSGSMERDIQGNATSNINEKRLTIAQDAVNAVLDKYTDQFNWSLQTLHNNGGKDTDNFETGWKDMKDRVNGIIASSGTPTTRRYYEIVSNVVMPSVKYRCQKSYVVLLSDGDANLSCNYPNSVGRGKYSVGPYYISRGVASSGTRYANFLYDADKYYSDYYGRNIDRTSDQNFKNAYAYFGSAKQEETDTEARNVCVDISGGSYHPFWDRNSGLGFFSRKLATQDFKREGYDNAGVSWDGHPDDPADFSKQLVQTFTVAFGSGVSDTGKTYLTNGASQNDYYFDAQSKEDLVKAFETITDSINNDSQIGVKGSGTVAPAATSSGISGMAAALQLDSGTWSSRLQFYGINPDGTVNTANVKYPYFGDRKTLINADGKNTYWAEASYGSNAMFGISGGKTDEWKDALVPWVIRSKADATLADTYGKAKGYSQDYRVRTDLPESEETRNLGDILDSPILTIGGGRTSDGLVNGRNEFLVTAANDGMVHLFRSHNDTNPYSLALSYIPAAMERENASDTMGKYLKDVANAEYGKSIPHRYMVNGGITVRRTAAGDNVKGQQSFLFGAMGQGGRGAYALNIGGKDRVNGSDIGLNADPSSWANQIPLFETAKTGTEKGAEYENKLGYTVGTPAIGRIATERSGGAVDFARNTRYAGFLAGGYGSEKRNAGETALYVYDMLGQNAADGTVGGAKAGDLIHKFTLDGISGLSSPTLVDTDFDGVVDVAYAGDYAGNLYRFDMRGDKVSDWKAAKIFAGSESRPITSAPAVSRRSGNRYVVIFGTGSDIYQDDVNDKNRQAVYGIYDDVTVEADKPATEADLQEQVLSEVSEGYRRISSTNAVGSEKKGWFVQLGESDGERVVVKPTMILRTAVISTRIYDQKTTVIGNEGDVCRISNETTRTSTSSWVLALNAETGGALAKSDARLLFSSDPNAYYNGKQYEGITSFTFMDATKQNDSPVTRDGDSGGSGTDQPFKTANTEVPNNRCFSRNAVRTLLLNSSDPNKSLTNLNVTGRVCSIRRLSWRELFF